MDKELHQLVGALEFRLFKGNYDEEGLPKLRTMGLPGDYLEFVAATNGGVGFIGENRIYTDFWNVNAVIELNPYYDEEFSRNAVVIGSDGSGTMYGYYLLEQVYFASNVFELTAEEITRCGPGLIDLVRYIAALNYDA